MNDTRPKPKAGETYETADGTRLWVRRVSKSGAWADIVVTQWNGATWTKRQPLDGGAFTVNCHRVGGES